MSNKPERRIGGSILPSSEPRILQPMQGAHGTLQVRPLPELDTHGLFMGEQLLASHSNGFSCHNLAERILAAWEGKRDVEYALEQFDYILRCGGMGKSRESIEYIARGMPELPADYIPRDPARQRDDLKRLIDKLALTPAGDYYKPGDYMAGKVNDAWIEAGRIVGERDPVVAPAKAAKKGPGL